MVLEAIAQATGKCSVSDWAFWVGKGGLEALGPPSAHPLRSTLWTWKLLTLLIPTPWASCEFLGHAGHSILDPYGHLCIMLPCYIELFVVTCLCSRSFFPLPAATCTFLFKVTLKITLFCFVVVAPQFSYLLGP